MKELNPQEYLQRKLERTGSWYLEQPCLVEYEIKGRMGHPSNYAFVKSECKPSETLSFESGVAWPPECGGPNWIRQFEEFICEGIVDGPVAASTTPYLGCVLNLVEIKFDDVSSSADAYYKATKGAMAELVRSGNWGLKLTGAASL